MRSARWRWVLLSIAILVVAGCVQGRTAVLPSSLSERMRDMHLTFRPATPDARSLSPTDVIARLKASRNGIEPFRRSHAVPVYGIVTCDGGVGGCDMSLSPSGSVWFVLFPDAAIADDDFAWAWVDGTTGDGLIHDPHVP